MSIEPSIPATAHCGPHHWARRLVIQAVAVCVYAALPTSSVATEPDSPDRAMEFVEKSVQATELFNEHKFAEALTLFQDLMQTYGDLDEDGYVAMSLADCLNGLGRRDEAKAMYQTVVAAHENLAQVIQQRIREMALSGPPDDVFLEELRVAALTEVENAYAAKVQLARALQKRAVSLLAEAVEVFRAAAETDPNLAQPSRRMVSGQAEMLAEMQEDLTALINRMDRAWNVLNALKEPNDAHETGASGVGTYRAEWDAAQGGEPLKIETTWEECGDLQVTVNGKPLVLNRTQSLVIRRHQERINALILEAMKNPPANAAATK